MSSSLCPKCKSAVSDPRGPCRTCGGQAPGASAAAPGGDLGDGWDDDGGGLGGGLDLSRGGSLGQAGGSSAYAGGGLSLGDDDDPFADEVPQASFELDLPSAPVATPRGAAPSAGSISAASGAPAPPGSVPDLEVPARTRGEAAPPSGEAAPPGSSPGEAAPPPAPQAAPEPPPPPSPPDPARLIARYPAAPAQVWLAPLYAIKVLLRQLELRQDLASLRKRRSPDVPLYERALRAHDARVFALGLAITCAGLAITTFLFFLPVILRFLRDPS